MTRYDLFTARWVTSRLLGPLHRVGLDSVRSAGSLKSKVDRSRYPQLNEEDLEERFTRGSGPGGQSVNKTCNCVLLKHVPTGLTVKCHQHRSLEANRREARNILTDKLDLQLNGESAVSRQLLQLQQAKSAQKAARSARTRQLKASWKMAQQKPDTEDGSS